MTSKIIIRCIDKERVKSLHKLIGKDVTDPYIDSIQSNVESFINSVDINNNHYTLCFRIDNNKIQILKDLDKDKVLYLEIKYDGKVSSEII